MAWKEITEPNENTRTFLADAADCRVQDSPFRFAALWAKSATLTA